MSESFSLHAFAAVLALLGVVITVASLLSGAIDRSKVPQVAVFIAIGAMIGPFGLGYLDVGLDSPALQVVATLSLTLVLFVEALTLNLKEVRRHLPLASLILGPGTLLAAAIITVAAMLLLGLQWPYALMLGAALASTDPVLLRGLLKWKGLPAETRLALRLESGLNDIVLLPIIFVGIAASGLAAGGGRSYGELAIAMLLLGPGVGMATGLICVSTLVMLRKRIGVRRDYESLFSLGVAFIAFGAGEAVNSSGYVAAFAAGATIAALDVELCDCFKEYGETTAELCMLFTFVLLGTSLMWTSLGQLTFPTVVFALLALAARPVALWFGLIPARLERRPRGLIAWFGPRGLSTLLLILVPIVNGVEGAKPLFNVACVVVLCSVLLHGGSTAWVGRNRGLVPLPVVPEGGEDDDAIRISAPEVRQLVDSGASVMLIDVRSATVWSEATTQLEGAVRFDPAEVASEATAHGLAPGTIPLSFCTCSSEGTSLRVSRDLRRLGFADARAVTGGWSALVKAGFREVPKG